MIGAIAGGVIVFVVLVGLVKLFSLFGEADGHVRDIEKRNTHL
jgi:hypothetical protein